MARLFWQVMMTLDGFFEGPDHDLSWHPVDDDFERYAAAMLGAIDGMVLGRRTHDLFASYWPSATEPEAPVLNRLPKHVFSRTRSTFAWSGARPIDEAGLAALKREAGRDLALFGSGELGSHLLAAGLVDEVRLIVVPVVLGRGTPTFRGAGRHGLRLREAVTWSSGAVYLRYDVAG